MLECRKGEKDAAAAALKWLRADVDTEVPLVIIVVFATNPPRIPTVIIINNKMIYCISSSKGLKVNK